MSEYYAVRTRFRKNDEPLKPYQAWQAEARQKLKDAGFNPHRLPKVLVVAGNSDAAEAEAKRLAQSIGEKAGVELTTSLTTDLGELSKIFR